MTATSLPWRQDPPAHESVAAFRPGPGITRLDLRFDIDELRAALDQVLTRLDYDTTFGQWGFGVLPVTRRPGTDGRAVVDLSGRYWARGHDYVEQSHEELVDEAAYDELVPEFAGTYIERVLERLREVATIGRVRVNLKDPFNANSWHRDPEPRLHVPIHTNPGSLFIVNHHATHLPADGSVYFTDTRAYHTALNGGPGPRVHLVAAIADAS
jgi:hypothetical protein